MCKRDLLLVSRNMLAKDYMLWISSDREDRGDVFTGGREDRCDMFTDDKENSNKRHTSALGYKQRHLVVWRPGVPWQLVISLI